MTRFTGLYETINVSSGMLLKSLIKQSSCGHFSGIIYWGSQVGLSFRLDFPQEFPAFNRHVHVHRFSFTASSCDKNSTVFVTISVNQIKTINACPYGIRIF